LTGKSTLGALDGIEESAPATTRLEFADERADGMMPAFSSVFLARLAGPPPSVAA
jgi:hypothetical protein